MKVNAKLPAFRAETLPVSFRQEGSENRSSNELVGEELIAHLAKSLIHPMLKEAYDAGFRAGLKSAE